MLKKLYARKIVRIPLKFAICLIGAKMFLDTMTCLAYGSVFDIPRSLDIHHGQNPISPPIPKPYPYVVKYEHLKNIKAFEQYQANIHRGFFYNQHNHRHLYNDHPCRQNPDAVDEFIQYGNIYRIKEYMNYVFVNKLKQEGIQIPESINQRIRQLQQYKLNSLRPLIPQL